MHRFILAFAFLAACGRTVTLTDDVDLTWDFQLTPFDRYVDKLHSPYVRGDSQWLWASSSDDNDKVGNWQIVVSDPSVLAIEDQMSDGVSFGVKVHAIAEGTVDVAVIDDHGERVGHGLAEVALPDRVELDAHGYLIVGEDARAPVSEARIAAGDTATYVVRYYQGDRLLYGDGVLTTQSDKSVDAQRRSSYLFERREWLTLTPGAVNATTTQLYVDNVHISDVQVVGVAPSEITDVALIGESEKGASDGTWLVVLAQATDALGRNVFGVDYKWDVGGVSQAADGDLYRYQFKKGNDTMVTAERGGHSDAVDIQSDRGYVDNSNRVGCAAAGGGSLAASGLVLAFYLRRRRRSTRNASTAGPAKAPAPPCV